MAQSLRSGPNGHQTSPHIQPHPIASPFMSSCGLGQGMHVGAPWATSVACANGYGIGESNNSNDGGGFHSQLTGCKYQHPFKCDTYEYYTKRI